MGKELVGFERGLLTLEYLFYYGLGGRGSRPPSRATGLSAHRTPDEKGGKIG